ncbi:3-hydroxyacyl-CoA dehydrogenase NAD-binding domain-containing protein [Chitinophaga sp. MM2321]|uniref:3-hydroxyacyl-CoA dehydrogenase family protein n=1 Tax=Chitinophaga sp. MM2321 TaxID=3137178 RepID=UPI0032D5964B
MERLTIIGCGTMGHSIALNAAWAGISVQLHGISQSDLRLADAGIQSKLDVLIKNELLQETDRAVIMNRIQVTTSVKDAVSTATFVIEAIPENMELKQELFKHLDTLCDDTVILASNTSGLSPAAIASVMQYPQRFVVTHFWNPAHLTPLVEVLRHEKTTDAVMERVLTLLDQMHKKTIEVKKEIPGFVGNRLQAALLREAQFLLEEGVASKEDIDAAVVYGIGRRLPVTGPLASADMGGLDIFAAISDYLFQDLSNATGAFPTLKKLVAAQKFGIKSGEGYYQWNTAFAEMMNTKRETELIRFMKADLK